MCVVDGQVDEGVGVGACGYMCGLGAIAGAGAEALVGAGAAAGFGTGAEGAVRMDWCVRLRLLWVSGRVRVRVVGTRC